MIEIAKAERIIKSNTISKAMEKYKCIMGQVYKIDVTQDTAFQKMFCDFYQLRRFYSDTFKTRYLDVLQKMKHKDNLSFKEVFECVMEIKNTREMSFSSKLIHTVDPKYPIWDSIVTEQHFKMKKPYVKDNVVEKFSERYDEYVEKFYKYMESSEGAEVIRLFDIEYPESGITNVKIIDFVLWQDRNNS